MAAQLAATPNTGKSAPGTLSTRGFATRLLLWQVSPEHAPELLRESERWLWVAVFRCGTNDFDPEQFVPRGNNLQPSNRFYRSDLVDGHLPKIPRIADRAFEVIVGLMCPEASRISLSQTTSLRETTVPKISFSAAAVVSPCICSIVK